MEQSGNESGSKGNKSSGANKSSTMGLAAAAAAALAAVTNENRGEEEDDDGKEDAEDGSNSSNNRKRGTPNFKDGELIRLALILAANKETMNIFSKFKNIPIGESVKKACELFNDAKTHVDLDSILSPSEIVLFSSQFSSFESTFVAKRSEKTIFNVRGRMITVLLDHLRQGIDVSEGINSLKQLIPVKSQIYVLACIIVYRYFHLSIPLQSRPSKGNFDEHDTTYSEHNSTHHSSNNSGHQQQDESEEIQSSSRNNQKETRGHSSSDQGNSSSGFINTRDIQSSSKRLNDEFSSRMDEMEKKIASLNESINQKSKQKDREKASAMLKLYNECILHGTDEIRKLADELMKKFMDD